MKPRPIRSRHAFPCPRAQAGTGRRTRHEAELARLAEAQQDPTSVESIGALRTALSKGASFVAGRAARIVGEAGIQELVPDLVTAFDRFLRDPERTDAGCKAKTAIAEALRGTEYDQGDVFLKGVRYAQLEPGYGGREDTAVELRGTCGLGLAETGHPRALFELARLLADRERSARMAACRGLGSSGRVEAVPLLRFKAHVGDEDAAVLGECLSALLHLDSEASVAFSAEFLRHGREEVAEAAALALGESGLPEAFDALSSWWQDLASEQLRSVCLLAMALLRRNSGFDFLWRVIAESPLADAIAAVGALATFRDDELLSGRTRQAVEKRASRELNAALRKGFGDPA